jgi:hypothetical protein
MGAKALHLYFSDIFSVKRILLEEAQILNLAYLDQPFLSPRPLNYCIAVLFLSSSKILTYPIPLSARRVCPPPATKERGMGGQYFGRRDK